MDDVRIYSQYKEREDSGSNLKIFLFIFSLIILSIGIAALSYYIGTRYGEESEIAYESQITASPKLSLPNNAPTASPSATPKPSLTLKLTSTPSVSPTPKPLMKSKILFSIAELDGFRSSNGGGNTNLEIRSGRNSSLVTRGFVSFEIDKIPADADIQSATLRLYQTEVVGNPYVACGKLKLDHLTYGDTLDETDYAMPALTTSFATLSDNTKVGWKEADVTSKLKDDVANARSVSQYRIHFETEVKGENVEGDFVFFESQDNSSETDNTPQLIVKYY